MTYDGQKCASIAEGEQVLVVGNGAYHEQKTIQRTHITGVRARYQGTRNAYIQYETPLGLFCEGAIAPLSEVRDCIAELRADLSGALTLVSSKLPVNEVADQLEQAFEQEIPSGQFHLMRLGGAPVGVN